VPGFFRNLCAVAVWVGLFPEAHSPDSLLQGPPVRMGHRYRPGFNPLAGKRWSLASGTTAQKEVAAMDDQDLQVLAILRKKSELSEVCFDGQLEAGLSEGVHLGA
jgi:hypothetical protein